MRNDILYPLGESKKFHQLGTGIFKDITIDEVFERLQKATGTTTKQALAKWLTVPYSQLVDAKKLDIVPIRWLQLLILNGSKYNHSWVLTGQGDKIWADL